MKSSWGNVKIIHDRGGCYIRGYVRKKYTRSHPYPEHITKIKPAFREKAAIIKLRRFGYRMQELASFFGRSTSYIYRVIKKNVNLKTLHWDDKRKMPNRMRLYLNTRRRAILASLWNKWEAWILGEGDKPP